MDGSFIEKLVSHMKPEFREWGNQVYSDRHFYPFSLPIAETIAIHSLSGLVEYCANFLESDLGSDGEDFGGKFLVVIKGPEEVALYSPLHETTRQREELVKVSLQRDAVNFGAKLPLEKFIVGIQSQFVQSDTTAAILSMVGRIRAGAEQVVEDDGVTQSVTVKAGIAKEGWEKVPNPVVLRPFRTFPEVEQPESKFILRVDASGPEAALYEADGGVWKDEATANIKRFLSEQFLEREKPLDNVVVVE